MAVAQTKQKFIFLPRNSLHINSLGFKCFLQKDRVLGSLYLIPLPYAGCFPIHMAQDVSSLCLHSRQWEGEKGRGGNSPFQGHHLKVALITSAHIPLTRTWLLDHTYVQGMLEYIVFLNLVTTATLQSFYGIRKRENSLQSLPLMWQPVWALQWIFEARIFIPSLKWES